MAGMTAEGTIAPDAVRIEVPPALGGGAFLMDPQMGRDHIVEQVRREGFGSFEHPLPSMFAACARRRGGEVLDVGANTGFYSLLAVAAAGARVHAFEPYPPVGELLRANVDLNRAADRMTIVDEAVSDRDGDTRLFIPVDDHGDIETSCSLKPDFKELIHDAVDVPVTTLDRYVGSARVGEVGVLKIDVEGLEARVLRGAAQLVDRCRPTVFVEVLDRADTRGLDQFCRCSGYVPFHLRADAAVPTGSVRVDPDGRNQMFVPVERRGVVGDLVEAAIGG